MECLSGFPMNKITTLGENTGDVFFSDNIELLNPLTPGHFAKKCLSKRVKPFLGYCLAEKNPNCPKRCLQVEHWTSFCS